MTEYVATLSLRLSEPVLRNEFQLASRDNHVTSYPFVRTHLNLPNGTKQFPSGVPSRAHGDPRLHGSAVPHVERGGGKRTALRDAHEIDPCLVRINHQCTRDNDQGQPRWPPETAKQFPPLVPTNGQQTGPSASFFLKKINKHGRDIY